MTGRDETDETWLVELRRTLAHMPAGDYAAAYGRLTAVRHAFHAELARALERPINDHLAALPQHTLADKQAVVAAANADLRLLGLGVRCPSTGTPAILAADFRDHPDLSSRFRFRVVTADGRPLNKDASARLPVLTIVEDPPRVEAFATREKLRRGNVTPVQDR